jgi:site-specific DNA recombinase
MTEPTATGAVVYVRVSRVGGRDRESVSYQTELEQRERSEAYARARGYDVVAVLSDIDASGAKWDRAGLDQAIRMVESGEAGAIIVYRLSRLGRGLRGILETVKRIEDAGGTIMSVNEGFDFSTAAGRLLFNMLASVDEYERELRGEYWTATRARATSRGVLIGPTPLGLMRDDTSRVHVDPETREQMRDVFAARAAGASFRKCAAMFDEIRPTRNGKPRLAHAASILLRNPIYKGELPHGAGRCEALLTEAEWDAAQITPQARRSNARFYLLSGIARCEGCGGPMVGGGRDSVGGKPVYKCRNASRPEPDRCGAPATIMADTLERFVLAKFAGVDLTLRESEGADFAAIDERMRRADDALGAWLADTVTQEKAPAHWERERDRRIEELDAAQESAALARMADEGVTFSDVRDQPDELAVYLRSRIKTLTVRRGRGLPPAERVRLRIRGVNP